MFLYKQDQTAMYWIPPLYILYMYLSFYAALILNGSLPEYETTNETEGYLVIKFKVPQSSVLGSTTDLPWALAQIPLLRN